MAAVSGDSSGAVILEVGDSGLRDWSAHRRSLLGKWGSEFEAIMQRCLALNELSVVLLEKEPTAAQAHMCMNLARLLLLSDMGDAAEALETILLRNQDVDTAGKVACFLSTIRRSQENACASTVWKLWALLRRLPLSAVLRHSSQAVLPLRGHPHLRSGATRAEA